ncbi:DUF3592 domain-containing protein [Vitreoscilla massiliensis]|uniref:DUF3592 domain-containing protein n=1 Tax=Vitreoscilla massiliensis TaxID=1689272 RepID=A0ABY4E0P0_9NEIS|nr:DUF3592 domain-containing protein [Vitreoscilla massiliensis]UOO89305.1 DUF3592 domain-containing protein [Vitreoscilla massiliensis]
MGFTMLMVLVVLLLLTAAVLMFYQGRRIGRFYREFERRATATAGVVVEVQWHNSDAERRDQQYHRGAAFTVVEFRLPNGTVMRSRTHTGMNPAPVKVGDTVQILYDPHTPSHMELQQRGGRALMAPLYYTLAAGFAMFALLALLLWVLLKVVMRIPI